ncbi:MAG: hypothetical protein BGO07_00605 [Alphaproteobacteria bacterium 40-19]|nr:MAG: hypothetical protein BGO07_00605 [Alphaproteobacteria bacterium 40-19]
MYQVGSEFQPVGMNWKAEFSDHAGVHALQNQEAEILKELGTSGRLTKEHALFKKFANKLGNRDVLTVFLIPDSERSPEENFVLYLRNLLQNFSEVTFTSEKTQQEEQSGVFWDVLKPFDYLLLRSEKPGEICFEFQKGNRWVSVVHPETLVPLTAYPLTKNKEVFQKKEISEDVFDLTDQMNKLKIIKNKKDI